MKIRNLQRGGNHGDDRYEAGPGPIEVADEFGKAMIARGLAEPAAKPKAKKKAETLVDNADEIAAAAAEED